MPDFAPNVTPRFKLHYHVATRDHVMQFRGVRGISTGQMGDNGRAAAAALFTAMAPVLADDLAFLSAEIALTDSDVFFPTAVPSPVTGEVAVATYSKQDTISHLTFNGRGQALGSKTNVKLYGCNFNPDAVPANLISDFVFTPGESAVIDAAVLALQTAAGIVAIDNSSIIWSGRVTLKVNDFWLRKVRQGL